jgi:arginine deiminase
MSDLSVSVMNEWDALKEVLVGDMTHDILPYWSPDWGRYEGCKEYSDKGGGERHLVAYPERTKGTIEQTHNLSEVLVSYGIKVHRPPRLLTETETRIEPIGHWFQYPRDPHLVIGKNIIETNNRVTARKKEHLIWGEIWQKKADNDPSVKYISMPDVSPFSPELRKDDDFFAIRDLVLTVLF